MPVRLIIKVLSTNDPNHPEADRLKYQPGDVVDVLPYGADPGKKIVSNKKFRVVDILNMDMNEALEYLVSPKDAQGIPIPPENSKWKRRTIQLDIASSPLKTQLEAGGKPALSLNANDLRSIKKTKVELV